MINDNKTRLGIVEAVSFILQGLKIALSKECRLYILLPVLVNLLLLSSLGYLLFVNLADLLTPIISVIPEFLMFLAYILYVLISAGIVFIGCYIFSTIATIIASPFYGLLADKAEMILNNTKSNDAGFAEIIKDIPRILLREMRKQMFFIPMVVLCLIISVIPVVNIISPVCWFLLTSWMGCLQFSDYTYDNHKIAFSSMHRDLKDNKLATLCFGAVIAISLSVPVLNILIPPAAVCAGTKYYLELQKCRFNRINQ